MTLARSLDGSDGQIKTLTLYNDPNTNPNEKFDILRHVSFSSINILTLRHEGLIRNQHSKIRRFYVISTAGGPLIKIRVKSDLTRSPNLA